MIMAIIAKLFGRAPIAAPDHSAGPGNMIVPVAAVGDPPAKARDAFDIAMEFILRPEHDGAGYHVTPGDSGGPTAYGIIKMTLATYRGVPVSMVSDDDIRALTPAKVAPIYRRLFWEMNRCDEMPPALGLMVFDFACGNPTAARVRLQRVLGVADDGDLGPVTMAALQRAWKARGSALLDDYHASRLAFYKLLSSYARFGRGWDARAARCLALAKGLE